MRKLLITPKTRFQIARQVLSTELEDEAVILELRRGTYFSLNDVGRQIWRCLKNPVTLRQIQDRISQVYDASHREVERDAASFLTKLLGKGLIAEVQS